MENRGVAMRVISWNMAAGFGHEPDRHDAAWQWLRAQDFEVALLQEAVIPDWAADEWASVVHGAKYPGQMPAWGSAVISRQPRVDALAPPDDEPWLRELWGSVVVAQPRLPGDLWFVSIHSNASPVSAERLGKHDTADVRRCSPVGIWEIELFAPALERVLAGRRFVCGGDLNSGLLFDTVHKYDYNARLFDDLHRRGFLDTRSSPNEVRTYFKAGKGLYQLDHVYVDAGTKPLVTGWEVLATIVSDQELSDHAPVLVTLDEPPEGRK